MGKTSLNNHNIYDRQCNVDYVLDKKFTLVGAPDYELIVRDQNSEIPLEHAILLVCIEDAIASASK